VQGLENLPSQQKSQLSYANPLIAGDERRGEKADFETQEVGVKTTELEECGIVEAQSHCCY
jgi:hypothetical protein